MIKRALVPALFFSLTSCTTHQAARDVASSPEVIFSEVTKGANVDNRASGTIVVGDFDNDGMVDFIAHDKLYRNITKNNTIAFEDVTRKVGLSSLQGRPMFMDINNDGTLDILTTKGQLFLQQNKKYIELSTQYRFHIADNAMTLSFGDMNGDGWPDVLVGRSELYENSKFQFFPPQVFINQEGKSFREESHEQRMDKFPAYVRGISWADYNNDKSPDIYYSNYRLRQNFLFQTHRGKMLDMAGWAGVQGKSNNSEYYDEYLKKKLGPKFGHTIGSVWTDLNNDGNLDLFVSNLVHKFVGHPKSGKPYDYRGYLCDDSKVYQNTGAPHYRFVDKRATSGLPVMPVGDYSKFKGDELWAHATAADYDNDGLTDMLVSQVYNLKYAHTLLFQNRGNFKFKNVSLNGPKLLDSYAAAWADLDNDGKMDLIVSGREAVDATPKLRIFKNVHKNKNNYLRLKLKGSKSGTIPVTTQVRVFHDKGLFMKQVEGVTGTMNQQNDPVLHFGLGKVQKINRIEIVWSSGKKQVIRDVKINTTRTITEGK